MGGWLVDVFCLEVCYGAYIKAGYKHEYPTWQAFLEAIHSQPAVASGFNKVVAIIDGSQKGGNPQEVSHLTRTGVRVSSHFRLLKGNLLEKETKSLPLNSLNLAQSTIVGERGLPSIGVLVKDDDRDHMPAVSSTKGRAGKQKGGTTTLSHCRHQHQHHHQK